MRELSQEVKVLMLPRSRRGNQCRCKASMLGIQSQIKPSTSELWTMCISLEACACVSYKTRHPCTAVGAAATLSSPSQSSLGNVLACERDVT